MKSQYSLTGRLAAAGVSLALIVILIMIVFSK